MKIETKVTEIKYADDSKQLPTEMTVLVDEDYVTSSPDDVWEWCRCEVELKAGVAVLSMKVPELDAVCGELEKREREFGGNGCDDVA